MSNYQLSPTAKKAIALIASAFMLFLVYYGSYLPWHKSSVFIATLRQLSQFGTVDEVLRGFDQVFQIQSPIGQEELVRHFGNVVMSSIQQNGGAQPQLSETLLGYLEERYKPILARERGMSFNQNLLLLGIVNQTVAVHTKKQEYLDRAEALYLQGLESAPDRPQFLYALYDLYRLEQRNDKALEMAEKIINLWPEDARIEQSVNQMKGVSTSTSR